MRLSYRVGLAALFIFAIFLIKRHLDFLQDDTRAQSFWPLNINGNPGTHETPNGRASQGKEPLIVTQPTYETTPIIVPNDRVIVMAKLAAEDTSWVSIELAEWRNFIYTVDDPNAPRHTPVNKGRESLAYLQYIVDHYHDLPATLIFLHSHKDGFPGAWHTDSTDYSNVQAMRTLKIDYVQQNGYVNLRCQEDPGCPSEIRPSLENSPTGKPADKIYAQAWRELFNNTDVPNEVGVPCCSQFAVSRDQVLKRPLSDYEWFYSWVLNNNLKDDETAHVMEYTWHIIFGKDPVYCPDTFECYREVFGNPFFW
ncbi:hypothetical protein EYZ11_006098 [Aspergillus tanneri]|uniref:Uncharacterized protein n=1 Tax=Aspergillus tanneri TaxID=1220188 RepID=A0A4S3JGR5_9EURO|nr:uncharacterized protein ATNIH1004_002950 [Aspergillus tanneri]KAA8650268.1 hypothetical protein ATNIH1004_002950 [Aspergillus tanneri]THC94430.1 hypothetical protein EYZ11_006098 [Aspergillus tanneri]